MPAIRQQTISLLKVARLLAEELDMKVFSAAAMLAGAVLDGHLQASFHRKEAFHHRVGAAGYFIDLESSSIIPVQQSSYALACLTSVVNREPINESAWGLISIDRDSLGSCCELRGWPLPGFWFPESGLKQAPIFSSELKQSDSNRRRRRREDDISYEIDLVLERVGEGAPDAVVIEMLRARAGVKGSCIKEVGPDCLIWSNGFELGKLSMQALKKRLERRNKKSEEILSFNQSQ